MIYAMRGSPATVLSDEQNIGCVYCKDISYVGMYPVLYIFRMRISVAYTSFEANRDETPRSLLK